MRVTLRRDDLVRLGACRPGLVRFEERAGGAASISAEWTPATETAFIEDYPDEWGWLVGKRLLPIVGQPWGPRTNHIRDLLDFAAMLPVTPPKAPNEDLLRQLVATHLRATRAAFPESELPEAAEILIAHGNPPDDSLWYDLRDNRHLYGPYGIRLTCLCPSLQESLWESISASISLREWPHMGGLLSASMLPRARRLRNSIMESAAYALMESAAYVISDRDPAHDPYLPLLEIWGRGYWPLGLRNDGVFVIVVPSCA